MASGVWSGFMPARRVQPSHGLTLPGGSAQRCWRGYGPCSWNHILWRRPLAQARPDGQNGLLGTVAYPGARHQAMRRADPRDDPLHSRGRHPSFYVGLDVHSTGKHRLTHIAVTGAPVDLFGRNPEIRGAKLVGSGGPEPAPCFLYLKGRNAPCSQGSPEFDPLPQKKDFQ